MNKKQKRSMLIHFSDGSNKLFEFCAPVTDSANLAVRLEEALDARHPTIEGEGALFVIPVGSVKHLQFSAAPTKLPAYAIKGASFKD
jgi:hypothetical protein